MTDRADVVDHTIEPLNQDNPKVAPDPASNGEKDPSDWVSGADPMTGAQASYLKTLCEEVGSDAFRDGLTKAEASELIDQLKSERDSRR